MTLTWNNDTGAFEATFYGAVGTGVILTVVFWLCGQYHVEVYVDGQTCLFCKENTLRDAMRRASAGTYIARLVAGHF